MRIPPMTLVAAVLLLGLVACGSDDEGKPGPGQQDAPLPQPAQASGAITEMPAEPGPGEVALSGEPPSPPPPEPLLPADERFGMPALENNPETGLGDPSAFPDAPVAEPTADDALAVVHDYYAAISAGDFARAHVLWSDGGRASGQTLAQFTAGFAQAASVQARTGQPGRIEGAAGSRFIEIPVSVRATQRDGSLRDFTGSYVLRRAVVDGASAEQRAWRIASAELREATP